MGLVIPDMSISLDGYVTGPNDSRENPFGDGAENLHAWLRPTASDDDRAVLQEVVDSVGAIVMGRTSFEKNEGDGGWGDGGPMGDIPCFVVTHHAPERAYPSVFTFVTDGVARAIARAQQVAGDKVVHLFGATPSCSRRFRWGSWMRSTCTSCPSWSAVARASSVTSKRRSRWSASTRGSRRRQRT